MKKSRTGSPAGEALASPPVVTVQLPLPVLDVLADTRTAFFGLCLDAGQQVLGTLMEQERERLCGPKNVPTPDRRAYRGGSVRGEVTLGGRRTQRNAEPCSWTATRHCRSRHLRSFAVGFSPSARTLNARRQGSKSFSHFSTPLGPSPRSSATIARSARRASPNG